MSTKNDFIYLFQDYNLEDLKRLPTRFPLDDFNFMITSQRTITKIYDKLNYLIQNKIDEISHSNFWADLRVLGLAKEDQDQISEFGKQVFSFFQEEDDDFKREHFILSNIRNQNYNIPKNVYENYCSKVSNFEKYLQIIPELNQFGMELLNDQQKIFFTECLNTFPKALNRYFSLPPDSQKALDSLNETGLKGLFSSAEQPYYKIARRFLNVCRAFDRRINFIKSVILSNYEENVQNSGYPYIPMTVIDRFSKILNVNLLPEIIEKSDNIMPAVGLKNIDQTTFDNQALPMPEQSEIQKTITKIKETLLIEDCVITQIISNLVSGKNIIIAGPVGTGKTHLATMISKYAWGANGGYYPEVVTATADWTTQEVIGGLFPKVDKDGKVGYEIQKGCVNDTVFRNWEINGSKFKRKEIFHDGKKYRGVWLVIDEFNRANIDRAFGEMFTALEHGKLKVPTCEQNKCFKELPIPQDYRIIGTLNTFDKHYLFKLSDALKRRFAFIELLPPRPYQSEEEKFYVIKRSLDELMYKSSIAENVVLNIEKHTVDRKNTDSTFLNILDSAQQIMNFIRYTKNMGTAILISIFKYVFVDNLANNDLENSLDNAFRSNVIPQLENVSQLSLQAIKAFACGNIANFLRGVDHSSVDLPKYESQFLKILHLEKKDKINERIDRFRRGQITDEEWDTYDPWKAIKRPKLPLFKRSLTELIEETRII